jgi:hypothetical protein
MPTAAALSSPTLSYSGYTETTISLVWSASSPDFGNSIENYIVYSSTLGVNGRYYNYSTGDTNDSGYLFFTFHDLNSSTNYWFYVEVIEGNFLGSSDAVSNTIQVTTAQPPTLSTPSITQTTVSLNWQDYNDYSGNASFQSYTVQMMPPTGSWSTLTTITQQSDTSYTVTGLSPGHKYSFRVYDTVSVTRLSQTFSSYSNEVTVTTISPISVWISPSATNINTGGSAQLSASVNGGVPPYSYQWYVNGNPVSGATSSTFIFSTNTAGTYTIYMVVTDSSGTTQTSNSIEITVNNLISFTESGLPSGTLWSVTLNGVTESSTTNTITFNEPNGTYSYTIATVNKNYAPSPSSGTFKVNGNNVNIAITFNLVTYTVTFIQNGLPSGTSWSITFNGITLSSTTDTLTFKEPNGTYSYVISPISGYRANTYSGTITINGNPVSNTMNWTVITYTITITENGIPNGTSWSATLTGTTFNGQYINVTLSSTINTITFNEPNGSYSYTIHLPPGYNGNNLKSTVDLVGSSITSSVKAYQTTNNLIFPVIAVIVIIAIVGAIFAMRNRRSKGGNN